MKIIKLLLVLVGFLTTGTLVFGLVGTGAWFSDTATSADNIITTGTLDLQVSGEPFKATDLAPGEEYSEMGTFCVENIGTTDLKFRGLFETVAKPTHDLLKFTTLKVEQNTNEGWLMIKEVMGNPTVETDGLPYYFKYPDQDPTIINHYIVGQDLIPSQEVCYRLSIKLDVDTPDDLQEKYLDFFLHLYATQKTNPGWE